MKCPGQDTRYWKPGAIFQAKCPNCGHDVEFFKDESTRRCKNCGNKLVNPRMDFGCAAYCEFAEQCLGELPPELLDQRDDLFRDRVAIEMKRYFGRDFNRIGHATQVARYAEKIVKEEKGDLAIVLSAAYLHDVGARGAKAKRHGPERQNQDQKGPTVAREILTRLVAEKYCLGSGAFIGECRRLLFYLAFFRRSSAIVLISVRSLCISLQPYQNA